MSEIPPGTELDEYDIAELAKFFDLLARFDQEDKENTTPCGGVSSD